MFRTSKWKIKADPTARKTWTKLKPSANNSWPKFGRNAGKHKNVGKQSVKVGKQTICPKKTATYYHVGIICWGIQTRIIFDPKLMRLWAVWTSKASVSSSSRTTSPCSCQRWSSWRMEAHASLAEGLLIQRCEEYTTSCMYQPTKQPNIYKNTRYYNVTMTHT